MLTIVTEGTNTQIMAVKLDSRTAPVFRTMISRGGPFTSFRLGVLDDEHALIAGSPDDLIHIFYLRNPLNPVTLAVHDGKVTVLDLSVGLESSVIVSGAEDRTVLLRSKRSRVHSAKVS